MHEFGISKTCDRFIAKQTNQSATTLSRKPSVLTAMKLLLNLKTAIKLRHHVDVVVLISTEKN